jgi:hypothetical protein
VEEDGDEENWRIERMKLEDEFGEKKEGGRRAKPEDLDIKDHRQDLCRRSIADTGGIIDNVFRASRGSVDVQGQSRTQAICGWPEPPTDNPPHAKSPAVHFKDRILHSIILHF